MSKAKKKFVCEPGDYVRNQDGFAVEPLQWKEYVVVQAINTTRPAVDDVLTPKEIQQFIEVGFEVVINKRKATK